MSEELQQEETSGNIMPVEAVNPIAPVDRELVVHLEKVRCFQELFGPQLQAAGLEVVFSDDKRTLIGLEPGRTMDWARTIQLALIQRAEDGKILAKVMRDTPHFAGKIEPIPLVDRPNPDPVDYNIPHIFYLQPDQGASSTHYDFAITAAIDPATRYEEPVLNRVLRLFGSTSSPAPESQAVAART